MAENTGEARKCDCGYCGNGHGNFYKGRGVWKLLALAGTLYLLALFANAVTEHKYIGANENAQTTISVQGDGEAYAAPDIATVSFSISSDAKTQTEARTTVDKSMKDIYGFLASKGVAAKDIKNESYDLYPKYEYQRAIDQLCPLNSYCPPSGKQVLTGYTVTQSVSVKIRNLDNVGDIVGGLADNGATNMNGPTFTVENPDKVEADARTQAIDKAKAKADELSKELGVHLVRIVSFNEGNNYPVYNYSMKAMAADGMGAAAAPAPIIPQGENKFTSNVTIVYEIN